MLAALRQTLTEFGVALELRGSLVAGRNMDVSSRDPQRILESVFKLTSKEVQPGSFHFLFLILLLIRHRLSCVPLHSLNDRRWAQHYVIPFHWVVLLDVERNGIQVQRCGPCDSLRAGNSILVQRCGPPDPLHAADPGDTFPGWSTDARAAFLLPEEEMADYLLAWRRH
ncbi:hypothetical protein SKAU_G00167840 [Synaphobranchus kaupii]|uniref:Uncharacterized protein n=1 Tax=Synaphobranchus kaupii TaxID=118154 RepID=A0A9Q1FJT6_SYNKA|nr:hypothetical protein SKAU_G00167840 [Synaphobranchus kaupii]